VWAVGNYGGRGLTVVAKIHNRNETMLFQHLARIDVKPGQRLIRGDSVGLCGTTGQSTGIHLHFEIRTWDGKSALGPRVWGDPALYQHIRYITVHDSMREIWARLRAQREGKLLR